MPFQPSAKSLGPFFTALVFLAWLLPAGAGRLANVHAAAFCWTTSGLVTERSANTSHPVSIVDASMYVNHTKTTIQLTCFAEDLELLQGVEARDDGTYDLTEIDEATDDHAEYLAEKIILRDANGETLKAKVTDITKLEPPEGGIQSGELMNYSIGFQLEFTYDSPPNFLTLEQQMVAEGDLLPSELKVRVKQSGSETWYRKLLKPSAPETFRFDWDSPPLSEKASQEEWDSWQDQQEEKELGIVSYDSVYSFIYIDPREVRNEVLVPLANLTSLMEFERADPSFLSIEEQESAAKKIEAFFGVGNPVKIDGVVVEPIFDRIDFYGLDLRDFAIRAKKRKVSMASGRVGIIMRYPTKGNLQAVDVKWDKFSHAIRNVDAVVFTKEKAERASFSMFLKNGDHNVYQWRASEAAQLPEIANVSLEDPDYHVRPHQIHVPSLTLVCGLIAIATLLFSKFSPVSVVVAIVLGAIGYGTSGLDQYELPVPLTATDQLELEDPTADLIFRQLHKNLFRAFDYSTEDQIYDALAKSVDGPLLRELYLQINDSLRIKEQGGAVANIESVNVISGQREPQTTISNGFRYRCKWDIVGTVEHWGHIHERTNQYDAEFDLQIVDNHWKITALTVLEQPPGVIKQRLRRR